MAPRNGGQREALRGSLTPETLRLAHLASECRGTKSLRNLASLPNSQRFLGSLPISLWGLSASTQTWTATLALKVGSVQ